MSRVEGARRTPWLFLEFRRVFAQDGWALLAGIPSLLAGATALALAVHLGTTSEDLVTLRYQRQAALRAEAKDYDTALVCYQRLIKDSGPKPEILFSLAKALQAKGDHEQANSILAQIAPVDRPGYLKAHMQIARSLVRGGDLNERTLKILEQHLRYALDGPESVEASSLLGQVLLQTGRPELAEPYLSRAVVQQPELLILLARLAHQQEQPEKARMRAEQARSAFQTRAEAKVDDLDARLNWATACVFLEDYPGAVKVLEQGLKISGDPKYRPAIARVHVAWADAVGRDANSDIGVRLNLLERGLAYDPNNIELLDRLGTILRAGGPEGERVRSTLLDMIAEGKKTPGAHFILGVAANQRGNAAEARLHWDQALRLDPKMDVVANNLAWTLAQANPPDLDRALELANLAIERRPQVATFRGTRGIVLMKMNRWADALPDLEADLASSPNDEQTHRALAEVYEHLGSAELASRHRSRAEALSKAVK